MACYIDPDVQRQATTERQRAVIEYCRRHGISVHRLHRDGTACRLSGPGVDLITADITHLSTRDLEPVNSVQR